MGLEVKPSAAKKCNVYATIADQNKNTTGFFKKQKLENVGDRFFCDRQTFDTFGVVCGENVYASQIPEM